MEAASQERRDSRAFFYFERPRLNQLFTEAVKFPLVVVCAGAGYGKTSAVHDFAQEYQAATAWAQLSERDNVGMRFWENFTHSMARINAPFATSISKLGFPDTTDKLNHYLALIQNHAGLKRRLIVMDDFHVIEDSAVIRFVEHALLNIPPETSLVLISRSTPRINIAGLVSSGNVFNISEEDLRFTDNELAQYFRGMDIPLAPDNLREIMQDTEGWAFAINLIAHWYQKAPAYTGYLRTAMKSNIFRLMETEIWDGISERLQLFMVRLSLIDHLSVDLLVLLADGDAELIAEMEKQNAYIRRDDYINAYVIHHLFLEFLSQKQELLPEEQKRQTYAIAGDWCNQNGFKIDALSYYEKIGDYKMIVAIFLELPSQIAQEIARYATGIFGRIPQEAYDQVDYLAVMHVRVVMCLGQWQEACALAETYEAKYLQRAEDELRNHTLGGLYYCWGILRMLICTIDDRYDFDVYFARLHEFLSKFPITPSQLTNHPAGPWISLVGSARKGAPQEYIEALARAEGHAVQCFNGAMAGMGDMARGELLFYQDDIRGAEPFILRALEQARERRQFEIVHRALLYTLRIAVTQGNYIKMEQALKDMEAQLNESEYTLRFLTYDIALACFYATLGDPEKIPDWLKDKFEPYGHASFIENLGNQAKARYCYLTKNYPPLLAYIEEQKKREAVLYGRIEMLAIEACIHYKMKERKKARAVLEEAYKIAAPNDIITPFIELGKDMRTLAAFAAKQPHNAIPKDWLESLNRKAASYAKRLTHVVSEYKRANNISDDIAVSPREHEILTDLSHGLSRAEIAAGRRLSINTVKMVINNVFMKLGAENLADAIRIATERKII